MHRRQEHQVAGAPGVELAVGEDAGHAELRHLGDVRPAEELPLVGQQRIDPGVVRAVADRVVVEERHRLVKVVQDLGVPGEMGVEDVAGQRKGHSHGIAVVVVRDVVAPVGEARPAGGRVGEMPAVDVHHAVAAIDLDHRRDQGDQVVADLPHVGALVDRQAVGELHERGRRAGLRRVNGAGDVVDRDARRGEPGGAGVVEADRARVGELGEARPVFLRLREVLLRGNRHGDPLAPLLAGADGEDAHPRRGLRQQAEVAMDVGAVGEDSGRPGDVAEDGLRRRHALRRRQIVGERRVEVGGGGVLADARRGVGVDRLREVGLEAAWHAGRGRLLCGARG